MENIFVEFLPPWVETGIQPAFYDKESGTVLQQTARMYARVNMLIRMFNKLSKNTKETVEDYINKFNELSTYVHDYFDNLDVQEEINNKLDAMTEAGTLQEIVSDYLNSKALFGFDTVADMKNATNLINGSYAKTLGYYNKNDGGGAIYKIRTVTNDDTIDEMFILEMDDTQDQLVAELVFDDEINIKQIGARCQDTENNKYDIKNYIDRYLQIEDQYKRCIKLHIPSGIWYTSGNLLYGKFGWHIEGDEKFSRFHIYANGTVITSYTNNQDYVFRLGDSSHSCHDWTLKNITFSSADFVFADGSYNYDTVKPIVKTVELHHAIFGITDNLFFNDIKGKAFTINGSWGNYFNLLNFYHISNENSCVMNFETVDSSLGTGAGIIGNYFGKMMFEMCHGHLMNFEATCRVYNNHFGVIRVEPGKYEIDGRVYTKFTDEILATWDDTQCTHYAVLNMEAQCNVGENIFDSIETNNVANSYYTYDGNNYTYDTIIYYHNKTICNNIFNNINDNGMLKDCKVIYLPSTVTDVVTNRSFNTFNNFATPDEKCFIFDVAGLNDINVNDNTYLRGNRVAHSFNNQNYEYFKLGNWTPAYRSISRRGLGPTTSGIGFLHYDKDTYNNLSLCVIPRTDITDISFINTTVNPSKKLYLRAKIPNGETFRTNVINRTANDTFEATLTGTGAYKIYEVELTNTWNVGDYLRLTLSGTSAEQRHIAIDNYLSA